MSTEEGTYRGRRRDIILLCLTVVVSLVVVFAEPIWLPRLEGSTTEVFAVLLLLPLVVIGVSVGLFLRKWVDLRRISYDWKTGMVHFDVAWIERSDNLGIDSGETTSPPK